MIANIFPGLKLHTQQIVCFAEEYLILTYCNNSWLFWEHKYNIFMYTFLCGLEMLARILEVDY